MVETPYIEVFKTVFPVIAIRTDVESEVTRPDNFGTAFAVAPGVFMTAAHVAKAASESGALALAGPTGEDGHPVGIARVAHFEAWPTHDIALLYCDAPATVLNVWMLRRVQVLTDLSSFGYPHAVTKSEEGDRYDVVFRAYKGYVIVTRGFERLPGRPAVYEVSCPFPYGMSGAPLLFEKDSRLVVVGVVLGESAVTYGPVEHRVGIAMIADEICPLHSAHLDGPIAARLGWDAAFLELPTAKGNGSVLGA